MTPKRCEVCGRPEHGSGNYIPREEYAAYGLLVPSEANRPAISDEEAAANLLTDEEFDAIIEREQREADEWAAARPTKESRSTRATRVPTTRRGG